MLSYSVVFMKKQEFITGMSLTSSSVQLPYRAKQSRTKVTKFLSGDKIYARLTICSKI